MPPKLYPFLHVYFFIENIFLFTDLIKNDNPFQEYARTHALYEIYNPYPMNLSTRMTSNFHQVRTTGSEWKKVIGRLRTLK